MKIDFDHDFTGHRTTHAVQGGHRMDLAALPAMVVPRWPAQADVQPDRTVRVRRRYRTSPGLVFDAWLDPDIAGRWLFATATRPMTVVAIDAREGGSFRFADREGAAALAFAGRYVEIVCDRRLVFTLCTPGQGAESRVRVDFEPCRNGCAVALAHECLSVDEARHFQERWTGILYGLGITLDSTRRSTTIRSLR